MMNDVDQSTPEWHALRCGKFTGSRFKDVMAVSKSSGKPLKARNDLIWELASERIQGYQPEGASSHAMQWGKDNETIASEKYQLKTGEFVESVPFVNHRKYAFVGVSPDGLVGEDGGIEIKCPKNPQIHLKRFIDGVPDEYIPQIQGFLWVTGRKWCDFISYDPDTAKEFRLLIIRVTPDEEYIAKLQKEVLACNDEVEAIINKLNEAA